jgi:hypothetical protein
MSLIRRIVTAAALIAVSIPAYATFHLNQIEQVIGGVNGDTSAQAVQLRMRSFGENLVSQARLVAFDATGSNPVIILDLTSNVANANAGDHILIVSSNFVSQTNPATVPDFVMTSLIPANYLAAGRLAWEDDFGTIYWSLSWGGTNYTGSNAGSILNDNNGDFGPPFDGPLPSSDTNALVFTGGATAMSAANATDYALTTDGAVFVNNAGASFTLGAATTPPVTHDMAVILMKVPKTINLKTAGPPQSKRVVVQVQNHSSHPELITNLTGLVTLEVQSLATNCADIAADLIAGPPNVVPRTLKPGGKLNVFFNVTFDCANDRLKGPGHEDYQYVATVHADAIDGNADSNPANDVCPRGPSVTAVSSYPGPYPGPGPMRGDPGCGGKTSTRALGADVLTDVVEK